MENTDDADDADGMDFFWVKGDDGVGGFDAGYQFIIFMLNGLGN